MDKKTGKEKSRFIRGFTLIELMAVIVILGIIGLITVPIVNQLMKDSKEKAYHSQIQLLEDTALRWGT